jgi:hypothetical protein
MGDFLKLLLPVVLTPTTYAELLKKLAACLFYQTWAVTFLLRNIPSIDGAFHAVENYGRLGIALTTVPAYDKLNLAGAAIALLAAGFSYAVQLHDRVSDLFKIRHRFDRANIFLPLAVLVGAKFSAMQLNAVDANRVTLMHRVFYKFASSRADKPLVDRHDIEHALDAWSWFWILLEGMVLLIASAVIAIFFETPFLGSGFAAVFILYWILSVLQYSRLERYVRPQVETIAGNKDAAQEVRETFCAL